MDYHIDHEIQTLNRPHILSKWRQSYIARGLVFSDDMRITEPEGDEDVQMRWLQNEKDRKMGEILIGMAKFIIYLALVVSIATAYRNRNEPFYANKYAKDLCLTSFKQVLQISVLLKKNKKSKSTVNIKQWA